MIVLYILLGLLALVVGLLSVPVVLRVEYTDSVTLVLGWLFLKIPLIPAKEKKKKKKEKPKKEKPPKEEKPKPEGPQEPNILQRFYQYQGIPGFVELLRRTVEALKQFGHGVWRSFRIRELKLWMRISGDDPEALVKQYGKLCAGIFPGLGWLSTHLRCKKGAIRADIAPDFTGLSQKQMACVAEISVVPRTLINAAIMLGLRLLVKVLLKFLRGAKPPKPQEPAASPEQSLTSNV